MENLRPLFSVVMPSYGVEKYLAKAVACIKNQTFSDWELLIVEDGSPDQTGKLSDELALSDDRIFVVHHEENKGLSQARNTGISYAHGHYIWFMDPDDTVDLDLLEKVAASLEKNSAQLVVFGHIEEYYGADGNFSYGHEIRPKAKNFANKKALREYILRLEQETIYGYAWNKIYNLDYIRAKGFRYETVRLIEDIVFNIQYCNDISSMNLLDIAPYHYAKRMTGSLTTKFVPDYYPLHRRRIQMLYDQQKYWGTDSKAARSLLGGLYGRYILSALERNCDPRSGMKGRDRRKFTRKVFKDPLFKDLVMQAEAKDSRMLKIALKILKTRSALLCTGFGRCIHIVRGGLPMLYSKTKSGR